MARTPKRSDVVSVDANDMTVDDYIKQYQKAMDNANKQNAAKLAMYLKEVDKRRLSEDTEEQTRQIEALIKAKQALESQGRKLDEKEQSKIFERLIKEKQIREAKAQTELYKSQKELDKELEAARDEAQRARNKAILESSDSTKGEKLTAFTSELTASLKEGLKNMTDNLSKSFSALSNKLDNVMSTYASYQTAINVRLQGTDKTFKSIDKMLSGSVGVSPFIKTQTMLDNVSNLVSQGIAYNIEQRAFLQTISENIATTFDAGNSALLRIVRIQQSDSTAARLGLEAQLTTLFNELYANTEYLTNKFDDTASSLIEASATMTNEQAIAFEYQVQKWLGAMYSLGFSDTTISNLANAIGFLGSGDVTSLTDSPINNLLVMATSRIGKSYADILTEGLDAETTNALLQSVLEYVQEIAQSTSNQVARAQYADVFGLSMSDLAASLHADVNSLSKYTMSYEDTIRELGSQMSQMNKRLNMASKLENVFDNLLFSLGSGIAESPTMYSIWKITSLIQEQTGGINIPAISVVGSGVDLNTTVENLVKLGVVGISTLGMIPDIIAGIGGAINPASILSRLGIGTTAGRNDALGVLYEQLKRSAITSRGQGLLSRDVVDTSSSMSIVSTGSGEDFSSQALATAKQQANAESVQEEQDNPVIKRLDKIDTTIQSSATIDTESKEILDTIATNISTITNLLQEVVDGSRSFSVRSTILAGTSATI